MSISLKYAVLERERRLLLTGLPEGVTSTREIVDRYVTGTRLRLREVYEADGSVVRKLGHKVRLTEGPGEVACTNFYLNDEHEDGTLVAEIDDRDRLSGLVPDWLEVVRDVRDDEAWTGAGLAGSS